MSLSDDEMLDSLADDMLMEMAEESVQQSARSSTPAVPPPWSQGVVSTPSAVAPPTNMPDLTQMMSQMMPMMSQMFGSNAGMNSIFGSGAHSLQQAPVSWQELVKRHVPSNEQEDWLSTIEQDSTKLHVASVSNALTKPHSRSYRTKASPMPNVFMEARTMLANLLNEAVRSAQLEHTTRWQELKDNVESQLEQTGMTEIFENKLKEMLRQRVANDPDYLAAKTSGRYHNITDTLAV